MPIPLISLLIVLSFLGALAVILLPESRPTAPWQHTRQNTPPVLIKDAIVDPPVLPLAQLKVGETAYIVTLAPSIRGSERRRLMDLGLIPGTQITAELRSPSGDPTAYIVRGALIALREEQALNIKVTYSAK